MTGATFLRKMNEAKKEREVHWMAFDELNEALKPEMMGPWKIEVEAKVIREWYNTLSDRKAEYLI
jgi:DNA phosphorothioation-dependent restriction protein DptG